MGSEGYVPWAPDQWNTPQEGDFQPLPVRYGNRNYMLVPMSQGSEMQLQSRMARWEPQRYDSEGLRNLREYHYNKMPKDKQRIRLVQLMNSDTQSQDLYCRFLEADYDETFQVPLRVESDEQKRVESDNREIKRAQDVLPPYSEDQDGDTDDEIERLRETVELVRWQSQHYQRQGRRVPEARADSKASNRSKSHKDGDEISRRSIAYEALSWCWGVEEPKHVVKIFGEDGIFKIRVKRDLALALKHLRLPDRPRTLWIDAICINQSDPDERNHQVQMMSQIYSRAQQVCVWLGEGTPDSKVAFDFIREEIMELKNFDMICSDERYAHKWQAVLMLMQAPWFSRRWVVQEIALANQAVIYCGEDSIPWKEFAIAVEVIVEVERTSHQLSKVMQRSEQYRHFSARFEYVSELSASLLVQATIGVFHAHENTKFAAQNLKWQKEHRIPSVDKFGRQKLLSLEFLVSTMSMFKAAEPRDAIYSLLSIARDVTISAGSTTEDEPFFTTMELLNPSTARFPIDYSRPYSDVCRDFVRFAIDRKHRLDPVQALDILCRPWALPPSKRMSNVTEENKNVESAASYDTKRIFPERLRAWKIRQCEITHTTVGNEVKWKLMKTSTDKWKKDPRTMSQYIEDISNTTTWQPRPDDPIWSPPKGWARIFDWSKTYEEREINLPSWVPQVSRAPFTFDHHPGIRFSSAGRTNADPLVGQPSDGHMNYNAARKRHINLETLKFRRRPNLGHHSMYVQGFELDEVDSVEDASQGGSIPVAWLKLGGWKKADDWNGDDEEFTSDPPDELWRTLVADRGRDNRNPPYFYAKACRESVRKGGVSSGRVDTTALINNERNSIVSEFCRRVQAVIWNRRMFKTKQGRLGLAFSVEKGDKVCILYGCTVPVILKEYRKSPGDLSKERFEDETQAVVACIRQWEKNCERKTQRLQRIAEKRSTWISSGEWREMMLAKESTEKQVEKDTAEEERRQRYVEEYQESGNDYTEHSGANSDEYFNPSPERRGETENHDRQMFYMDRVLKRKERKEDADHYHILQGDCYLHGMMDGEAMREKFYRGLPDRIFELR